MSNFSTATPAAQFAAPQLFQFDGDWVHLQTSVEVLDAASVAAQQWALQLWACQPSATPDLANGIKVAELALDTSAPQASYAINASALALPPAGQAEHALVLALVSSLNGAPSTLQDSVVLSETQQFTQPSLEGDISFTPGEQTATLEVTAIVNPRSADNLSGTLALEVWALAQAYQGGSWSGNPVASLVLGQLSGQAAWHDNVYHVNAALPLPAGYLTLMLREWTPSGYLTRDFRTLSSPAEAVVAEVVATEATVVEAAAEVAAPVAEEAAVEVVAPVAVEAVEAPAPAAPAKKSTKPKAKAKSAATSKTQPVVEDDSKGVSVNTASELQLVAVKGLGVAVVRGIIAGRPYAKLDELCRVKGMGPKLLDKVRDQIKL